MMSPLKVLLSIISLFAVLGIIALIYPNDGIHVGDKTLRYPKLTEIFEKQSEADSLSDSTAAADPEEAIREMMEATKRQQFAAFSDSLKFYEDFFEKGRTRFDLPNNDPTWFDRFFLHLELAALESTVVHIVHYGDSQLEEDRISATIREDLQDEFGGAGPGMMPAIMTVPSQTTSHASSGALSRYILFGPKDEEADHSRYGPLAQLAKLNGDATITIQRRKERKGQFPHVGAYKTIRLLTNKSGRLKVRLNVNQTVVDTVGQNDDGTPKEKHSTKVVDAGEPTVDTYNKLKVYTWKLKDTTSIAKMYLSGNAEIYAIAADGAYGVAVDNVAMRGSSGTIFHRIDTELLAESYKAMNARLVIMEYGGNLVPSTSSSNIEWTKKLITRQIQAVQKANPDADILFIGPADMARQKDGQWQTYAALNMTIKALREVALDNGAAYWDMHRVMGGNGAMIKWVNKEPALGFTDHIHFTRRGAAYMGDLFCSALRMHYDYFKFRDRHNISDEKLKDIHKWSTEEQIEKEKNALPERTFLNVKRRTKKAKGGAKK
ncbi:Lysophospholipase L1 [Fibrobacter sp. UWB15]|uniref:GDSL-type esterase/lipase family protein n=1 Tax=unclassified Fibrobacter TaxID=2634177 RepID=UPI000A0B5E45|nr:MULTISPECIES: GDSL-type esterase/lipase family protein [unclassified Fibrobacter]PWJ68045.1 lysophospholipase L1-like esterase [Fibrobacter sp. UWB6]SMG17773.1 Lysophospholipase L1 [Fibrobacter sp. UWB15]